MDIQQSTENFATATANLGVQIGSHERALSGRTQVCRPPNGIVVQAWFGNKPGLNSSGAGNATVSLANIWGGLIYILVPKVWFLLAGPWFIH